MYEYLRYIKYCLNIYIYIYCALVVLNNNKLYKKHGTFIKIKKKNSFVCEMQ